MKKFKDFLNESISKRFQYDIDKNSVEDFEHDLAEIANEKGITYNLNKTNGVSKVTIFLRLNGEKNSVNELTNWIKERY